MILRGAQLLLPKFLANYIGVNRKCSNQDTPPSRDAENKNVPFRRSPSGGGAAVTPNDEMNSSTKDIKSEENSPHWAQYQIQISPMIEQFIPKSTFMRILYLVFWPITLFCFLYIYLPLKTWRYIQSLHVYKVSLEISLRKNELIR